MLFFQEEEDRKGFATSLGKCHESKQEDQERLHASASSAGALHVFTVVLDLVGFLHVNFFVQRKELQIYPKSILKVFNFAVCFTYHIT